MGKTKISIRRNKHWTFDETKSLVETMLASMDDNKPLRDTRYFKERKMLIKLERQLQRKGIARDSHQISMKIMNMRHRYLKAKAVDPSFSSNEYKKGEFMNEMRMIFDGGKRNPETAEFRDPLLADIKKEASDEESIGHSELSTRDSSDPELSFHSSDCSMNDTGSESCSDLMVATKMLIKTQKEIFEEQAKRDAEEAEKDRTLLERLLESLKK